MKKSKLITFAVLTVFFITSCKNDLMSASERKTPAAVERLNIGLDNPTISLVKATTQRLQVKVLPENAADKKLTYFSSEEDIASVDDTGLITAKKEGTTIITIKASNGVQRKITVIVTPEPVPVENIVIEEPTSASLVIGETYKLKAKVAPDTATDKALTYNANNDNVFIADDGTVTARKEGSVIITVTAANGGKNDITKTVTFTVKKKPEIKYKSKLAVIGESTAGTISFNVQTINGKLDYTPELQGAASWVTDIVKSNTDDDTDTVTVSCTQNKTVWDRRAYIKFKDNKTQQFVKGANGKDIEATILQQGNKNPNATIQWVRGIGAPAENEKQKLISDTEKDPDTGSVTVTYYDYPPYIFKWKETASTKFFNARKLSVLRQHRVAQVPLIMDDGKNHTDMNQCWAKTATNMLHWWFAQNQNNISAYTAKKGITGNELKKYDSTYTPGVPDINENTKSVIANIFRRDGHDGERGEYAESALRWYLLGSKGFINVGEKDYSMGLFADVFNQSNTPITVLSGRTKKEFEDLVKDALNGNKAVGLYLTGANNYAHWITLWGAAFDEKGNIICVYVSDSNLPENVLYPFGIYYEKDLERTPQGEDNAPHIIYYHNASKPKRQITLIATLDKGEAQWQKWFAQNP